MSLIVNTRTLELADQSRSPASSERTPTIAARSTDGERPGAGVEVRARDPERRGERHPVHVAARRGRGPVQVAVRIDPEDAAGAVRLRHPAERPDRDRVVAAEHERQVALGHAPSRRGAAIRPHERMIAPR